MDKLLACLVAAVLTFAIAACGDDDDDDGSSSLPTGDVSKEDYIAQADAVCTEADAQIDAEAETFFTEDLGLKGNDQPTSEQINEFIQEVVVPEVQSEVDELRELEAPEENADELAEIYDTVEENLDALAANPEAATEEEDPFEDANALARDYGFEVCGSD